MVFDFRGVGVEDTYCEAFDGLYTRLLVTALDERRLRRAAYDSTALPCTVLGESEAGVECFVGADETPDGRIGAFIQIWVNAVGDAIGRLDYEVSKRVRQGILVVPSTRVFNALESETRIDTMFRIGHCGDGFERVVTAFGREMIDVPIMAGSFLVEKNIGYKKGIMGGNLWFMCDSIESGLEACDRAEEAVSAAGGVILSFREGCGAGSKAGGKYKHIGPSTNHSYCPTLRKQIADSKVPDGVESIPEIVLNGPDLEAVKKAMKAAMEAVAGIGGLKKISAGNYGGKLGRHKIHLKELI